MKQLTLLAAFLAVAIVSAAQQSPQAGHGEFERQDSQYGDTSQDSCLVCRPCPNSSADTQTGSSCLLCRACPARTESARAASGLKTENQNAQESPSAQTPPISANSGNAASASNPPSYQPLRPSPAAVSAKNSSPSEWQTHSGAIDLHYEVGGVFHGPSIAACDLSTGFCADSGRTHIAGNLGVTYWIRPTLGLSLESVLMDGGSIAGTTQNAIGAYLGLQFQRSRGSIRPYLEVAPGYIHSFATGNSSSAFTEINPDVASVRAGGGFRFFVGKRWGVKVGVNALPSFNGIAHQTFVTATGGVFWQSKGRVGTE